MMASQPEFVDENCRYPDSGTTNTDDMGNLSISSDLLKMLKSIWKWEFKQ